MVVENKGGKTGYNLSLDEIVEMSLLAQFILFHLGFEDVFLTVIRGCMGITLAKKNW